MDRSWPLWAILLICKAAVLAQLTILLLVVLTLVCDGYA